MRGIIFITGASGFLGSQIARLLLRNTDHELTVLVRGKDDSDARRRLERIWSAWPETNEAIGRRVRVIRGDLLQPHLGINPQEYSDLVRNLTHIIHSAAELELDGELEALRRINVQGTARLLELAKAVNADHGLERYAHVSTAYVAGGRTGSVAEEDLSDTHGFVNAYEQTKYEGECLVRKAMVDFPVSVFRPGMVVGDSRTGEIQSFNTVYVPLRLYLSGRLKFIPTSPDMPVNIVPVDYVAGAIARLTFDERARGLTFHLTTPSKYQPSVKMLLETARTWAATHLGNAPSRARFVPLRGMEQMVKFGRHGVPACLQAYFKENRNYRLDNVERLFGSYTPDWHSILPRLFEYAVSRGFLRRTGRTVHEQILDRLQSSRIPVRIHDLAMDGSTRIRGGVEMSREIKNTMAGLKALGVGVGDRVSLVGMNSSRYLSLDTAIGLSGAVSVPLYYTAPVSEIKEILETCGARLLLIGAPSVLTRVADLPKDVVIVSFCTTTLPEAAAGRVISWESFQALGASASEDSVTAPRFIKKNRMSMQAPVGFSDLATLRFTSGTTGSPKGVTFRHGQVLWMAETLASLLPWNVRISPVRYLSFLPMNHVVEGILGTYAPSYLPAPVDIFFLEDFHVLSNALPRVRPTVFFSVPRFYEKVWERFAEGSAGRLYLRLGSHGGGGMLRRLLRPVLRLSLLRRAGLDKCAQLLAGSAPCSELLLQNFRELGIEIHNAYGMTEAPLVTMNRHGSNHLGTVGVPLPETEVRLGQDNEIFVRGPQVTNGYFGSVSEPLLTDGWLATGDLGKFTTDGKLIISGRKKDILITSYGKNIHPFKIEGMLRQIPGMKEAMVIGDNMPSLSALLWLTKQSAAPGMLEEIDNFVRKMNECLSHPERVRRWAILADSPAIETGELTGNLKLRRQTVLTRRNAVVQMLYNRRNGAGPDMSGVLHIGENRFA